MKRIVLVAAAVVALAGTAAAAPGDPRAVRGTLEWPATLGAAPFIVLRGDDGNHYYVEMSSAPRAGATPIRAGEPMSVLGVEGSKPHEIAATTVAAGEAQPGAPPPPSAPAPATSPAGETSASPGAPERPWQRVEGTVKSLSDRKLVVATPDGRSVDVDVSRLSGNLGGLLRSGEEVTVYGGVTDGRFVASGLVQRDRESGSALPGQPR